MSRILTPAGHGLGYIPDLPDFRDHIYAAAKPVTPAAYVDLRESGFEPPVYDQLQLGACTANAIAAELDFQNKAQGGQFISPSRMFIYYGERDMEGTVSQDAGAAIRDGIQVVHKTGAPPESDWAYDITKFAEKPPAKAYTDAPKDTGLSYARVLRTGTHMEQINTLGKGFVFGFSVYESFESQTVAENGGVVPMPEKGEQMLGGHAVRRIGYTTKQYAKPAIAKQLQDGLLYGIVRNSWGADWGDGGYFYMPETYFTKRGLTSDFWVIETTGPLVVSKAA